MQDGKHRQSPGCEVYVAHGSPCVETVVGRAEDRRLQEADVVGLGAKLPGGGDRPVPRYEDRVRVPLGQFLGRGSPTLQIGSAPAGVEERVVAHATDIADGHDLASVPLETNGQITRGMAASQAVNRYLLVTDSERAGTRDRVLPTRHAVSAYARTHRPVGA